MAKRFLAALLTLVMLCTMVPVVAYGANSGTCGGDVTWRLSGGTLHISGEGKMEDYSPYEAPWYNEQSLNEIKKIVIDYGVTTIGEHAFQGLWYVTDISIPNSITSIGGGALDYCNRLTSITIPESVTNIAADESFGVFRGTYELSRITVNEKNPVYSSDAYGVLFDKAKARLLKFPSKSSLTSYAIPSSVTDMECGAFQGCGNLTGIVLPSGLHCIPHYAFYESTSLTALVIPNSVTTIESFAFSSCHSLPKLTIPNSVTSIGSYAFSSCWSLTSMVIPSGVSSISEALFQSCESLRSVVLPNTITSIGNYAFDNCFCLETITIPDGVTTIGDSAFSECVSLTSMTIPDSVTSIGFQAFYDCSRLTDIYYAGTQEQWDLITRNVSVPNGATIYYNCRDSGTCGGEDDGSNLTWTLNDGTLTISGKGRMKNCRYDGGPWCEYAGSIKKLVIEEGVTSIGNYAFYLCRNLTEITLPDSITSIGNNAFDTCENLVSVTFGRGLRSVGSEAFSYCPNLRVLYFTGNAPKTWANDVFGLTGYGPFLTNISNMYYRRGASGWPASGKTWNGLTAHSAAALVKGPSQFNKSRELIFPCDFDTKWFSGSSYNYQHELALASMVTTFATYNKTGTEERSNYADADANLKGLYEQLGFTDYGQYGYHEKPTLDSIACGMASQKLRDAQGDYTLVAVGIRSGGYEREWGSDFTIGSSDVFHQGFLDAAVQVKDALNSYLQNTVGAGRVKFWITGYSRGAATADLLGYALDNGSTVPGVTWEPKDVFTYCFEVPQACMDETILNNSLYNNIFCIVNPVDFVPKVAPYVDGSADYRYRNIGTVLKVPRKFNTPDSRPYSTWEKEMIANWDYIFYMSGSTTPNDYEIDRGSIAGQAWALDYLVTLLFGYVIPDKQQMVEEIQPSLRELCYEAVELLSTDLFGRLGEDIVAAVKTTAKSAEFRIELAALTQSLGDWRTLPLTALSGYAAYTTMRRAIAKVIHADIPGITEQTANDVCDALTGVAIRFLLHGGIGSLVDYWDDIGSLPQGHYPDLCLAWMLTLDDISDYLGKHDTYTTGRFNCPVNVQVYNSSHELEAAIVNDQVQEVPCGNVFAYIDENGQKCFVYPNCDTYSVEVEATGDGEFTCTYFTYEDDQQTSIVSYQGIPITKGTTLTGAVSEAAGGTMENREPSAVFTGEDICRYQVVTGTEGHGSTTGDGAYQVGDFARVVAEPDPGEEFLGWYINGGLVSTDAEYRFQMLKDTELVAKFSTDMPDFRIIPDGLYRHPDTVEMRIRVLNYLTPQDSGEPHSYRIEMQDATDGTAYPMGEYSLYDSNDMPTGITSGSVPIAALNGIVPERINYYFDGELIASMEAQTVALERITLSQNEATVSVGDSLALNAEAYPSKAYDPTVVWSSSDESVAVVNGDGIVTAVGCGSTAITAISVADSSIQGQCIVTVPAVYTELTLDQETLSMIVADTARLEATLTSNGADSSIIWSSLDPAVATVEEDGVVTAVGTGATLVQATAPDGTLSASCRVAVRSRLSLSESSLDAAFAQYLQSEFDSSAEGWIIPENVTELHCAQKNIQSLTGVEKMLSLETLDCSGNDLTTLDLSRCSALRELDCSDNANLTSLILPRSDVLVRCDNTALKTVTYANQTGNGKDVSGHVNSVTADLLVQLWDTETDTLSYQVTTGEPTYQLRNVAPGSYRLIIAAEGRVSCPVSLEVGTTAVNLPQVTLVVPGDLNGALNGIGDAVSPEDMQCLYEYLSTGVNTGTITETSYFQAVADINGDGIVNILDYQALYEAVKVG